MCAAPVACTSGERPLRIGLTHTLEHSAALATLDSLWTDRAALAVIVAPSGQILRAAAAGDLDIVVTHAPTLEQRLLVEPGHAAWQCPFVASRFAVVGPGNDPARVRSAADAADAFHRIARAGAPFISRGDSSGTHVRELALWKQARVELTRASWRVETGADQMTTIRIAEERHAYALVDVPTLLRQRNTVVPILFETDTALVNRYTFYVVRNPRPHPVADTFARWALKVWRPALGALQLSDGTLAFAADTVRCPALEAPHESVL
jgi:tungstate transport system substrate-binding protein